MLVRSKDSLSVDDGGVGNGALGPIKEAGRKAAERIVPC
jgi:hypothetical protein